MATLYTLSEKNIRKTWLYLTSFFILVIFVGWFLSYFFEAPWILFLAFFWSLIMSFSSYWWSDKIVLSLTKAKPIEKKDNPELYRIVENLCITAGLPLPRIYIVQDASPNAFATGRDPEHSAIAVTSGLLETLERVELEGVIAHELSHIGNRDTLLATVVVILVGVLVFISNLFLRGWIRFDSRSERRGGAFVLIFGILLLILAPILAQLIRFAISRKREFLADSTGVLLTRYPEGLARALEKISKNPKPLLNANNATAHLYIVNPFKGKQALDWFVKIFSTHPPIEERIKAIREMEI